MKDALIVFAKIPIAGHVKTRLTTRLSPEDAARLYAAFLRDALTQYEKMGVAIFLFLAPSDAEIPLYLKDIPLHIKTQHGPDLGARMQHAFLQVFAQGFERLVIIGTDHPTLPTAFIHQAFVALADPMSVCIGPSEDGGYYLLGMNEFYPELFENMTYSHDQVFQETLHRAVETRANLTVLPSWYDVDTPEELQRCIADLQAAPPEAHPHIRTVLHEFRTIYPFLFLHSPEDGHPAS